MLTLCAYPHIYTHMNYEQAKIRADILGALAHPVRVMLIAELAQGDRCVSDLCEVVDVDQSNVSRHLAQLKRAGIVTERRDGQKTIHHLECPCILKAFDCAVEVLQSADERRRAVLDECFETIEQNRRRRLTPQMV